MADHEYEFSSLQNRLIADLARKMSTVGIFLASIGSLSLLGAVLGLVAGRPSHVVVFLFAGGFFLATGLWTVRGGRAFRAVVDTEGHDIALTMRALLELDRFYSLSFWMVIVYVLIIVSAVVGCPQSLGGI